MIDWGWPLQACPQPCTTYVDQQEREGVKDSCIQQTLDHCCVTVAASVWRGLQGTRRPLPVAELSPGSQSSYRFGRAFTFFCQQGEKLKGVSLHVVNSCTSRDQSVKPLEFHGDHHQPNQEQGQTLDQHGAEPAQCC